MIVVTDYYIDELKQLIKLHLASQGKNPEKFKSLLHQITSDEQGDLNSWALQWEEEGDRYYRRGEKEEAMMCYNFGRFPFSNSKDRLQSHQKCIEVFKEINPFENGLKRVEIDHQDTTIPVYVSGEWTKDTPLFLVMGGIVSIKEQWGVLLQKGKKLGYAVCVSEFPSVGENPLEYNVDSYQYVHAILNQLSMGKKELKAVLMGISFSGELMIKTAATRDDILGVICSGSPIQTFFEDKEWKSQIPETTWRTLEYLCKENRAQLTRTLEHFSIGKTTLQRIKSPIKYIACIDDDIVPPAEVEHLKEQITDLEVIMLKDIHGGLNSMPLIKKYIPLSLIEFKRGKKNLLAILLRKVVKRLAKKHQAIIQ